MKSAGFPVDLVLLAMIAGFLILRLRSILGRRTGYEGAPPAPAMRPPAGPVIEAKAEPAAPARPLPAPESPAGLALAEMRKLDRRFDPAQFLGGAEKAFRLIVTAFAAGDRARLKPLLTEETYAAFERAIAAREAAGDTQSTDIRAIQDAALQEAQLAGTRATIIVRFVSEQVNRLTAADGQMHAGTDRPAEHADLWTFARDLGGRETVWRLASASTA